MGRATIGRLELPPGEGRFVGPTLRATPPRITAYTAGSFSMRTPLPQDNCVSCFSPLGFPDLETGSTPTNCVSCSFLPRLSRFGNGVRAPPLPTPRTPLFRRGSREVEPLSRGGFTVAFHALVSRPAPGWGGVAPLGGFSVMCHGPPPGGGASRRRAMVPSLFV